MASRRGMTLRNEAAQQRIDAALAAITDGTETDLPQPPARTRDAILDETLRLEWIADVLEAFAVEDGDGLDTMTKAELVTLADERGIEIDSSDRKAEILADIRAAGQDEGEGA